MCRVGLDDPPGSSIRRHGFGTVVEVPLPDYALDVATAVARAAAGQEQLARPAVGAPAVGEVQDR